MPMLITRINGSGNEMDKLSAKLESSEEKGGSVTGHAISIIE